MNAVDIAALRALAAALNRGQDKYPNPFYVGFGDAILAAIGDPPHVPVEYCDESDDLHDLHPQPGDPASPVPAGVEGYPAGRSAR